MTTDTKIQEQLIEARAKIAELEQKTKTTLSGSQFLVIV